MGKKMVKKPRDSASAFDDFADGWQELRRGFTETRGLSAGETQRLFAREQQQAREDFSADTELTRGRFVNECEELQETFEGFRKNLAPLAQKLEDERNDLEGEEHRIRACMDDLPAGGIVSAVTSNRDPQTMASGRSGVEQAAADFHGRQAANRATMAAKKRRSLPEV